MLGLSKGFQHLFWPRAHRDVLREIYPADYSARIDEKLCRARNVGAFGSCAAMQHIVSLNHFRLWIREKGIGVAKFLSLAPIDFWCVHTNRDDLNPAGFKFWEPLLKTPQLGVA